MMGALFDLHIMSAPIKVAIRADAGAKIGMGHFGRASAVARALAASGDTEIVLVTTITGASHAGAFFPDQTKILVLSPEEGDPALAMQILRRQIPHPDVLLLDQYGAVAQWEVECAKSETNLVVLDDLDAARDADIIVRPHGVTAGGNGNIVLAGPAYLPLSDHVVQLAHGTQPNSQKRPRLNICFGGSDPTGETAKALEAVANLDQLDVDVVIGPGAQIDPALVDATARLPHIKLHRQPSQKELAALMATADLALGAGGVMLWERLCLGIPSLVIATAENQLPQIESMLSVGAVRYLGYHSELDAASIVEGILALADDEALRQKLSDLGPKIVDGRGALRLAAWIKALALEFRDVQAEDAQDLLDWRTDDRNWQHNWDGSEKPAFDAHVAWLSGRLADPNCIFRILTLDDDPVGVVRFDLSDCGAAAYLSIYLVPAWHGQRIGLPVYYAAERALRQSHPAVTRIVSRIHKANAASERLHRDAGFEVWASYERTDWLDAVKLLG